MRPAPTTPVLLDCDLLVGHDVTTGTWARPEAMRKRALAAGISGGLIASLRATHFDVRSGNDEAITVADGNRWHACPVLDLRDPLGAERELERLADLRPHTVRLTPGHQGVEPVYPAFGYIARLLAEAGLTTLVEGDVRTVSAPFRGLGARVVFLDTHFYHLGDYVVLARDEPGFMTSTRLLNGPDSLEIVAAEVGAERLLLGTRTPFYEGHSAVRRLLSSRLTPDEVALAGSINLRNVLELS